MKPILLVEDTLSDEKLTLMALANGDIANPVIVVRDGAEALDYLFGTGRHAGRDPEALPQVVLLDLGLPKLGGLEVLREIRARPATRLLPVVVLTSSTEDRDVIASYNLGANSFVSKPVHFDAFTRAVSELGLYWAVVNRPPA